MDLPGSIVYGNNVVQIAKCKFLFLILLPCERFMWSRWYCSYCWSSWNYMRRLSSVIANWKSYNIVLFLQYIYS